MATVVVLGAGTAGAAAARSLRSRLSDKHRVVLVEKEGDLHYQPGLLHLMVGRKTLQDITRHTGEMRAGGSEVKVGKATSIDPERQKVRVDGHGDLHYDYLILATGANVADHGDENLSRAGYNLWTPEGALAAHRAIADFSGGEIAILVSSLPYRCPPALCEAAFLLDEWFRRKRIRDRVGITIHTPESAPFAAAGRSVISALAAGLKRQGIKMRTGQRFRSVDPETGTLHFDSGTAPFDLLLFIPRHRPSEAVAQSGLTDESGWVPVDPFTLQTRYENVYALGDVNRITLPSGVDLPMSGEYAHFQAFITADNVAARIQGRSPKRLFGGKTACITEVGTTALAFFGNFYRREPHFVVLPESRVFLPGKTLIERFWLYEHS